MPSRVGLLEKVKILPEPIGFPAEYRSDYYEEAYAVFLIALIIYIVSNILPAGSSTEYVLFTMFLERLSPLILVVATVLATEQVSKVFTNILSALSKEEIALTVEKRYLQIVIKIVICLMDINMTNMQFYRRKRSQASAARSLSGGNRPLFSEYLH